MIKKHTETQSKEVEIVDDIICNQCGVSLKDDCDTNFEGLIEHAIQGGYASKLGDMVTYRFSLCEDCLSVLFKGFKHSAFESDMFGGDEEAARGGGEGR